ncbi:hypothetical protein HPB50_003644 [Hyalomma asiaticum]|uniref:Uncharacterized protein n=1 Tax=Hyalomma asiaticum TaxID=266040 RepID=A0ACB7SC57_HYAAI|nr:hypothetical protein HPB50_003644 [Hyalomma asiaticum]
MASVDEGFRGLLALVTGGASGIGRAVCHTLATDGAVVVVADKQLEVAREVAQSLPGDASHRAVFVDVGESLSVEQLFNDVRSAFTEPLSIVVHCAGILRRAALCDCTDELFDDVVRVNLRGTFLVNRAASRDMLRFRSKGGAAIVNISSIAAKKCAPLSVAYCAAKAGVVALTKSAASELGKHGIRCNAVLPGLVETPLMANTDASRRAAAISQTPLNRTAQPWEIAEAIKFLCSPTASSYVTGAALEVTGGFYM